MNPFNYSGEKPLTSACESILGTPYSSSGFVSNGLAPQYPEDLCSGKVHIIYPRFSTDMQRKESNENQERYCREYLQRVGLGHLPFIVIADEEVSGTKADRPGWNRVNKLIAEKRLGILIVFEVSRMDRGDHAVNQVRDIQYQGGRFLSSSEFIDSDQDGWENLVRSACMQASGASGLSARRVFISQQGIARTPDRCNGDRPYAYLSEFVNSEAERAASRQRHHPKYVVIDPAAAEVVVMIFTWFVIGTLGIGEIVRRLVALGDTIPLPGRGARRAWNRDIVRRILANTKYAGIWPWGRTKIVRDSRGKIKHAPTKPEQVVRTERPHLQIIDSDLFERAQVRLNEFKEAIGYRADGGKRGPKMPVRVLHGQSLVMGLIHCRKCGLRMHNNGGDSRVACPGNTDFKSCDWVFGVNLTVAEAKVAEVLGLALAADHAWLPTMMAKMTGAVARAATEIPNERERLIAAKAKIDDDVKAAAAATLLGKNIQALVDQLAELEAQQRDLQGKIAKLKPMPDLRALPDEAWIRKQLDDLPALLKGGDPAALGLMRAMIGRIDAEPVLATGKKRGYARLRLTLSLPMVADGLLRQQLHPGVRAIVPPLATDDGRIELVIDLGEPTKADQYAGQVYAWRQETPPVAWKEIARRTDMHVSTCQTAHHRYRDGLDSGTKAA